jgi:hypothetical protein
MTELEADPSFGKVLEKLNVVLALLASDPTDRRLRRIRFQNGLWAVVLRMADDDYTVLWDGDDLPESVTVRFIGQMKGRR